MSPLHQPSCVAMRCGALPLPLELFLAFKDSIPFADLRTHVCFYKAHPHIATLYDGGEHADRFWQRACWYNGISALQTDDTYDPHCWRDIAVEVVERDGFCTYPHCGEALIQYNRQRMLRAEEHVKPLSVLSRQHEADMRPAVHRALVQTAFRPFDSSKAAPDFQFDQEAHLRPVGTGARTYQGSTLLKDHPLIARSFATDVPVGALRVGRIGGHTVREGTVARPFGVTVHDVLAAIYADLDVTLTSDALLHFLMVMFDRLPADWAMCMASERLRTIRGLLGVSHLSEYIYDGSAGGAGPCFSVRLTSGP